MVLCGWPGLSSVCCCVEESEMKSTLATPLASKIFCGLQRTLLTQGGKSRRSVPLLGVAPHLSFSPLWSLEHSQPLCSPWEWADRKIHFILPPRLSPVMHFCLSLHLNPSPPAPGPPSHPNPSLSPVVLLSSFPRVPSSACRPTPHLHSGWCPQHWVVTDSHCLISLLPHTTFPYCEEACQSPVPPITNWELSPAGNNLQTQLADW